MKKREGFQDFVLDQLGALGDIDGRRMFGSYGLYHRGLFFAILSKGRLYFKVHEDTRKEYVDSGMKPFRPTKKLTLKSYYEVPHEILENRERLAEWARKAIRRVR